jgi:carotenoid cleavage oxygenase
MTVVDNPYLVGNYGPVREEITATDLPVEGTLPAELNGRLLRNGPNPIDDRDPATYHWFTGDGMLHAIHLGEGRALSYRNRWVRTDAVVEARGEKAPDGQPDDVSPIGSSRANTNVVAHAGRILALEEVHLPVEVSPDLETIGRCDFGGLLQSPMTAHPKIDPVTGEMVFFGYNIFGPPYVRYHVVDAKGNLTRSEDITFGGPVMVHDFNITENYVVWMDLPVVFDMELATQGFFPFKWDESYGSRVGVMPRDGGDKDVTWIDIDDCYVFHPMNAYEDGDRIVVDVTRHPNMFVREKIGPAGGPTTLDRWTIDTSARKVVEERIDDRAHEFPRVDDRLVGRRHRYGYGTGFTTTDEGIRLSGLYKFDLQTGTTETHAFSPGMAASEGVFVPASDTAGEDEGWVLAVVHDPSRDSSDVVVLDATDFTANPVATVHLPARVPFGFHGNWVPDA